MSEDCNRVAALIQEIHSRKVAESHRAVLVAMAGDADPNTGYMQLSIERLAWLLDKSESQARRDLQSVVSAGLLTTIKASKGRFPSVYAFNPAAAQPKQITRGSERVDYAQPTKVTGEHDRVSDSQPANVELGGDRVQDVPATLSSHQNHAFNGRDARVGNPPPKNPLNTKDSKANTSAAQNAPALFDLSPEVAAIMAMFTTRPPDIKHVQTAISEHGFDTVKRAVQKGIEKNADDVWKYANGTLEGWKRDATKTPPSVSPVSPSTNGNDNSFDLRAVQREQMERNARRAAAKKASGQS